MCVQRGRPAKTAFLPPPPLVEEGCSTVYFNLPKTVWDSVRVPQVVFGDGKSPFEVLLVRARAGYDVCGSSHRTAAGQYLAWLLSVALCTSLSECFSAK